MGEHKLSVFENYR